MTRRPAAPYLRILLAWLLAMQPMIGAYAAAGAAGTPRTHELCRGATIPADPEAPHDTGDHSHCCPAACLGTAAAPPGEHGTLPLPAQSADIILASPPRDLPLLVAAGFWPQSARAPPSEFSFQA